MSIVIVALLLLLAAAAVAYPLLPGRAPSSKTPAVTDSDIEKAVRDLRRARRPDAASGQRGVLGALAAFSAACLTRTRPSIPRAQRKFSRVGPAAVA